VTDTVGVGAADDVAEVEGGVNVVRLTAEEDVVVLEMVAGVGAKDEFVVADKIVINTPDVRRRG
jgi:hypothetical protein